jgi:hypothetical protein
MPAALNSKIIKGEDYEKGKINIYNFCRVAALHSGVCAS